MLYSLSFFFSLQNAVCLIMLNCLVPVLFTFYLQGVLKLKKNNSGAKGLMLAGLRWCHQSGECVKVCTRRVCVSAIRAVVKFTFEQATKTQWGVAVWPDSFFNLGARWGGWSMPHPGRFTPTGKRPGTHCIGGWVGPRALAHTDKYSNFIKICPVVADVFRADGQT